MVKQDLASHLPGDWHATNFRNTRPYDEYQKTGGYVKTRMTLVFYSKSCLLLSTLLDEVLVTTGSQLMGRSLSEQSRRNPNDRLGGHVNTSCASLCWYCRQICISFRWIYLDPWVISLDVMATQRPINNFVLRQKRQSPGPATRGTRTFWSIPFSTSFSEVTIGF